MWLLAVTLLVVAAFASLYAVDRSLEQITSNNDFAAYYCAGQVARVRADPYALQPLELCRIGASNPAPLPGYTIALFSLVSFLPYQSAATECVHVPHTGALYCTTNYSRLPELSQIRRQISHPY